MTDARVKIDVEAGQIELEGESAFVSTYLDKLLPLIEARGLGGGSRPAIKKPNPPLGSEADDAVPSDATEEPQDKKKRRVPKRPPAGSSCRDRIMILKGDGFFKEHRSPTDIVAGLAKKGWTHKSNQVSASLGSKPNQHIENWSMY